MAGQDVPDGDAEGGPRKLDEGEHGAYMTEAWRNFNIAEILKPASDPIGYRTLCYLVLESRRDQAQSKRSIARRLKRLG
jgi:hypothetical protein